MQRIPSTNPHPRNGTGNHSPNGAPVTDTTSFSSIVSASSWDSSGWSPVDLGDALPRPDHPDFGGPLHVANVISRETDEVFRILETARRNYEQSLSIRFGHLYTLLSNAQHAAAVFRGKRESVERDVHRRREARAEAQRVFSEEVHKLHVAADKATEKQTQELEEVKAMIAQSEQLALRAHAQPGVPPSSIFSTTRGEDAVQSGAKATGETPRRRPFFAIDRVTFLLGIIGIIYGISVVSQWGLLNLEDALSFEPETIPWLACGTLVGVALILINHKAAHEIWHGAAKRATEQNSEYVFVNAAPAFLSTLTALAIEAMVMRDYFVTTHFERLPDPASWTHYLAGLCFLFTPIVLGAAQGFDKGTQAARDAQKQQREHEDGLKKDAAAQAEQKAETQALRASAPAQMAQAIDGYLASLYERKASIESAISAIRSPYEKLIGDREAQALANPEQTETEARLIQGAVEDARKAYKEFLVELEAFCDWREPRPKRVTTLEIFLHSIRKADNQPTPKPTPTLWARIKAFFARLFGRGNTAKPEEEA